HDLISQIHQPNNVDTLPPGNCIYEMLDKTMLWIQKLQHCLENIHELFGNKLANVEYELNVTDFENFRISLCTEIEDRDLNSFTSIHLPFSGVNGLAFARTFLTIFFNKSFLKIPTCEKISYVKLLEENLSNRCSATLELLKTLAQCNFFEEFEVFANADIAEPA
ncbi:13953_t:CDS:2, partial [Racocetra persica]